MKTAAEILKLREAKAKEDKARIESMRAKEDERRKNAKNRGIKFAAEVNVDPYVESLIDSGSREIDMSLFMANNYPNYTEYESVNRNNEMKALMAGVIEGLTQRFEANGFKFKHCTSYAGLIFELSI